MWLMIIGRPCLMCGTELNALGNCDACVRETDESQFDPEIELLESEGLI